MGGTDVQFVLDLSPLACFQFSIQQFSKIAWRDSWHNFVLLSKQVHDHVIYSTWGVTIFLCMCGMWPSPCGLSICEWKRSSCCEKNQQMRFWNIFDHCYFPLTFHIFFNYYYYSVVRPASLWQTDNKNSLLSHMHKNASFFIISGGKHKINK